jgi:formylglycine-generating enzyme required for sulfatase activity
VEYCNKLSLKEGLTPAYTINGEDVTWNRNADGYRLPTEAEWEYACRAGTTTPFNTGDDITTAQANYDGNETSPVGSFAPNAWGLYDMHGNMWEWCWDWYGGYNTVPQTDPIGVSSGSNRVLRGGGWGGPAQDARSAGRANADPTDRFVVLGIRLVRPAPASGV